MTARPRQITRVVAAVVVVFVVVPAVYVADQARRTLRTLAIVERQRDMWQRPDDVLGYLQLADGMTVVDLGSGAGYFALKIAPRVRPNGRVFAVDLRRQSLAFLWIRAFAGGHANLHVILGQAADPKLSAGPVDAVLMANTYHELTAPDPVLRALFNSMRSGARLVVVDRGPRDESRTAGAGHHETTPARAENEFHQHGFHAITRDDRFIDRPEDEDVWWLIVFRKP